MDDKKIYSPLSPLTDMFCLRFTDRKTFKHKEIVFEHIISTLSDDYSNENSLAFHQIFLSNSKRGSEI